MKQIQKSGDDSINFQAESMTVHQTGLTYADVREIALDLFRDNFVQLSEVARDTARRRAEEITDLFLQQLQQRNQEAVSQAQDPDFQYSLLTVQKEYARTGDKDLGDLLVDILVERTKVDTRGLMQIVLNESLGVAPKLTNSQLNALSIIFSLKYTRHLLMTSLKSLRQYIGHRLAPFTEDLARSPASYQHLEFSRCGSISLVSDKIPEIFRKHYPGIFTKGFSENEFLSEIPSLAASGLVTRCLRDNALLQFNAIDHDLLRKKASELGTEDTVIEKMIKFWNDHMMSDSEIGNDLISAHDCMGTLFDVWDTTPMRLMTLTSVGIAIAHAYTRSKTGDADDLSIWIN